MTNKKSTYSFISYIIGIILIIISYNVSEKPNFNDKILIGLFFFSGILSILISIILGIRSIKSKETSFLKYFWILSTIIIILGILLYPILMGLFGFKEP